MDRVSVVSLTLSRYADTQNNAPAFAPPPCSVSSWIHSDVLIQSLRDDNPEDVIDMLARAMLETKLDVCESLRSIHNNDATRAVRQ